MTDHSQYDEWLRVGGPQPGRSQAQAEVPPSRDIFPRTVAGSWSPVPTAPGSTGPVPRRASNAGPAQVRPARLFTPRPAGAPHRTFRLLGLRCRACGPSAAPGAVVGAAFPRQRRTRKSWVIALSVGGVLLVVAVLFALACLPTFLDLSRDASGASLFDGGVPSSWALDRFRSSHRRVARRRLESTRPGGGWLLPVRLRGPLPGRRGCERHELVRQPCRSSSSQGWDAQMVLLSNGAKSSVGVRPLVDRSGPVL